MKQLKLSERKRVIIKLEPELIDLLDAHILNYKQECLIRYQNESDTEYLVRSWDRSGFIRRMIIDMLGLKVESGKGDTS